MGEVGKKGDQGRDIKGLKIYLKCFISFQKNNGSNMTKFKT